MTRTSPLWRVLGLTTLVCLIVMLMGFAWAIKDTWYPQDGLAIPSEEAPQETASGGDWSSKKELFVTAIGDSLTKGTGDPTGEGYVDRVTARLSDAMDKPVKLVNNLAINGLRADQLIVRLEEKGFKNAIARADIVLLTIGGNDLFQFAQNGGTLAEGGDLSPQLLLKRLPEAEPRLEAVFKAIRELNPTARIAYVGLYNAFYDLQQMQPASKVVSQWNDYAFGLAKADGNASVVPTYDLFEFGLTKYLSSDHFHPNDLGYARIADRVVQALQ